MYGLKSSDAWVQIPVLLYTDCVISGKYLNLSVPWLLICKMRIIVYLLHRVVLSLTAC